MKSGNRRLQFFNAGLQMLSKLSLTKIEASRVAKQMRQEKQAKRHRGWSGSGCGARECARRRQQMAYDAGQATRRALQS